ncbi:reverse transcriptase domain-containing protein [Vagococcus fluvialis]|uniref:reverse transcriptase domain-containing protein n=1 Tax=Vagococcus fluvialis TaxID=2738 RepID=UPI003D0BE3CD
MIDSIYEKVSNKLFQLFVANDKVIALQMKDGRYIPKKIMFDSHLFEQMLVKKSSLATYQQIMYTDKIKWICFDFDCKTEDKDIKYLFDNYIKPFCSSLEEKKLNYLLEFSGRRGIHVWLIFDKVITKKAGYDFSKKLIAEIETELLIDEKYALDLFPAVAYGSTKLGKAVKVPLSVHKKGERSYFFRNFSEFLEIKEYLNEIDFFEKQYEILSGYKINNSKVTLLNKQESYPNRNDYYVKEYVALNDNKFTLEEIFDKTRDSIVLDKLWDRILSGRMTHLDRKIIVGIFGKFGNEDILFEIFSRQNNYDRNITNKMIFNLKKNIYPIKMWYLYSIYNESIEAYIDENISLLTFICDRLNIEVSQIKEEDFHFNPKIILKKELNYLQYNDEVVSPEEFYGMKNLNKYDLLLIQEKVLNIISGSKRESECITPKFKTYYRKEKNKNLPRKLTSLSVKDRLLTTYLTYELVYRLQPNFQSYSYNLNFLNDNNIFFPWISSWRRFVNDVQIYLEFDLFSDYSLMKIDISNFYDSIWIHSIYKLMVKKQNKWSKETHKEILNIMEYLAKFNNQLIYSQSQNLRGVPQGPVYARVMAEYFISTLIQEFFNNNIQYKNKYRLYRYVDDIYIIYRNIDGDEFLRKFKEYIENYDIELNMDKTKNFNTIGSMGIHEKKSLFGSIVQNYEIQSISDIELESPDEREKKVELFDSYLTRDGEWDIKDANFILGMYLDPYFVNLYIDKFFNDLVASDYGRGSIFKRLYELIFSDLKLLNRFINEKKYQDIPVDTVNIYNFISVLFFKNSLFKTSVSLIDYKALLDFFGKFKSSEIGNEGVEIILFLKKELNNNEY